MSSTNFRNVSFLIILLAILGTTFVYITITQFSDVPIYAELFHREED